MITYLKEAPESAHKVGDEVYVTVNKNNRRCKLLCLTIYVRSAKCFPMDHMIETQNAPRKGWDPKGTRKIMKPTMVGYVRYLFPNK